MQSRLTRALRYPVLASALALACCAPPPSPPAPPPPPPVQQPAPTPAPTPVVQQLTYENWLDAPATQGGWSYRRSANGSMSVFSETSGSESFAISCGGTGGEITLARAGRASSPVPIRILTETGQQMFTAEPAPGGAPYLNITMRSRNPMLDAMALTRGRFAVETAGLKTLYLPAWAEVTRVIEDCR